MKTIPSSFNYQNNISELSIKMKSSIITAHVFHVFVSYLFEHFLSYGYALFLCFIQYFPSKSIFSFNYKLLFCSVLIWNPASKECGWILAFIPEEFILSLIIIILLYWSAPEFHIFYFSFDSSSQKSGLCYGCIFWLASLLHMGRVGLDRDSQLVDVPIANQKAVLRSNLSWGC